MLGSYHPAKPAITSGGELVVKVGASARDRALASLSAKINLK